ncbi:DNA helicase/exodeoxyribonuclease V, subunit A [Rhodopseudomonas palustris HaA2]|uniref:DNA 3'-5' helicase n=1 Tax=Rhodopseudomonas palustris (strain HaA2) TaxID=316058 RepID=Q2J2H0_RHOP2|nr:double-strand break repair helicase AddA [Rhodopseudomonas palustris]ABD05340.1 DNA helicase/exodeoxyribonuclease V, subunit A [Rhodopseudomonas palustris HaA2]
MSGPRSIPDQARERQILASDPSASVFVSANAGSGKTHVLVQRVIRLLLDGVPPERILCITFTKAAAANMAERVFTTLGRWVTLDDAALTAAIKATGIKSVGPSLLAQARKLFACALETPGGLKVQTIHALCTRLLQQFPFEANVPARFSVLDDRDQAELMQRASLAVLLQAAAAPDSAAGRALALAMTSAADITFREVVQEACMSRDRFLGWIAQAGGVDGAMAQLSVTLGVAAEDDCDAVERDIVDGPHLPRARWTDGATIFDGGSKTDHDQAQRLRDALAASDTAQLEKYLELFFTKEAKLRKSFATKKIADPMPGFAEDLKREGARLEGLLERRRALLMRERTRALLVIAFDVAERIRREKQERGLLDYDDLIDRTLQMLDSGASSWVHFKLDRGVDHVLIDEAQDTSPKQWDIVAHLIAEFTAGEGAREGIKRTVFAVGDEKQSIFSFQGAVPKEFAERRDLLQRRFHGAGLAFEKVSFNYSFRSGATILQSVDHVFRDPDIYRSIHADTSYPLHEALTDAGPSLIDLWPLEVPDDKQEIEGWRAPFDAVSETSPEVRLADKVRAEIASLIASGTMTGPRDDRRRLRYGDVLVLVRRRGSAFDAVIQALKRGGIPVAGADRLKLTEHIAIIDLMNLADALLLPQDDLALAVALKSPLFGFDDDDLFRLAWRRKGSLRAALRDKAAGDAKLTAVLHRLDTCAEQSQAETPFGFYAWLLGGDGGRARILRRLGPEANDALDEFLELALSFERKQPPSLQGFVAWLRAADTEIKRDMEISRDEVRVMTVHGAKGLEALVVFLVDTTSSPADSQRLNLIRLPGGNAQPGAPSAMVWAGRKADDPRAVEQARAAMISDTEDEYRRLLYVAMTRAADRLIVGGCMPGNRNDVRALSWYDLISKGLENSGLAMRAVPPPDGAVKRYCRPEDEVVETAAPDETPAAAPLILPNWLHRSAPALRAPDNLLRPSDAHDADHRRLRRGESEAQRQRALQRGTLVHRLLQSLPDLPADARASAAARYLARNAKDWNDEDRDALAARVLQVITATRFAVVFAPGSRAEVPIAGRLQRHGEPVLVSGQIDRLVVTDAEVLIVDYKTNQVPPRSLAETPPAYLRQLALYRAVLARLYPQRPVRAALLWTEAPEIMEISASALDAEQAALTVA